LIRIQRLKDGSARLISAVVREGSETDVDIQILSPSLLIQDRDLRLGDLLEPQLTGVPREERYEPTSYQAFLKDCPDWLAPVVSKCTQAEQNSYLLQESPRWEALPG
jgi:hypothetical protein